MRDKRGLALGGLILGVAVAAAVAFALWGGKGPRQGTGGPPPLPEVAFVTVEPRAVTLATELPGRTSPYQIAEIRPQVGGIIQSRQFREGADVAAGALLYQIDPAPYQASLDSARAQLAKAEATLASLRNKAERYRDLVAVKAVSQQDYDDADAALRQGLAQAQAERASVETARINLGYTRMVSPIAGRIGKSVVTAGALVNANQSDALTTVQQLDPIFVDVTQSSTDLLRLRADLDRGALSRGGASQAEVSLILEDGTRYPLKGRLEFTDVTVDQNTGSVTIRATFPNPRAILLPGMYVRAVVETGRREQAIVVPQQGVMRDTKGNATALVLAADDKTEGRALKLSRALGDQWLVDEGLKAGDRLIVEGSQRVRPGVPAKAVPFTP